MFVQASLRRAIAASLFCAASFTLMPNTSSAAALAKQPIQPKQTKFELLTTFGRGSLDGQEPIGVVATANGNLWGTAIGGQFEGIIFEMSAAGGRRNIFDFTSNGPTIGGPSTPFLGPDGNIYGTTGSTFFWVDTASLAFHAVEFNEPSFPLEANAPTTSDGAHTLYGSGSVFAAQNCGEIYAYDVVTHAVRVVTTFPWGNGTCPEGGGPAQLVYAAGYLYGIESEIQSPNAGAVFRMRADGTQFSILRAFNDFDGAGPGGLVVSGNRVFGFTTGAPSSPFPPYFPGISPNIFAVNTDGSDFQLLYRFPKNPHFYAPPNTLLMASNGQLCGAAGSFGHGTRGNVFCLNGTGSLDILHVFRLPPADLYRTA